MNPRNNYFSKLVKYIKNVYHIDKQIEHVTDCRINPTYKTSQIISLVLIGFILRIQSFNELSFMIKSGEFNSLFSSNGEIPKIDTIRSALKTSDFGSIFRKWLIQPLFCIFIDVSNTLLCTRILKLYN